MLTLFGFYWLVGKRLGLLILLTMGLFETMWEGGSLEALLVGIYARLPELLCSRATEPSRLLRPEVADFCELV